jgi:hypothetical protein
MRCFTIRDYALVPGIPTIRPAEGRNTGAVIVPVGGTPWGWREEVPVHLDAHTLIGPDGRLNDVGVRWVADSGAIITAPSKASNMALLLVDAHYGRRGESFVLPARGAPTWRKTGPYVSEEWSSYRTHGLSGWSSLEASMANRSQSKPRMLGEMPVFASGIDRDSPRGARGSGSAALLGVPAGHGIIIESTGKIDPGQSPVTIYTWDGAEWTVEAGAAPPADAPLAAGEDW